MQKKRKLFYSRHKGYTKIMRGSEVHSNDRYPQEREEALVGRGETLTTKKRKKFL